MTPNSTQDRQITTGGNRHTLTYTHTHTHGEKRSPTRLATNAGGGGDTVFPPFLMTERPTIRAAEESAAAAAAAAAVLLAPHDRPFRALPVREVVREGRAAARLVVGEVLLRDRVARLEARHDNVHVRVHLCALAVGDDGRATAVLARRIRAVDSPEQRATERAARKREVLLARVAHRCEELRVLRALGVAVDSGVGAHGGACVARKLHGGVGALLAEAASGGEGLRLAARSAQAIVAGGNLDNLLCARNARDSNNQQRQKERTRHNRSKVSDITTDGLVGHAVMWRE